MHRLNRPSLLEEDENEDDINSSFGMSSNRFLKTKSVKERPMDDFQKELQDKVARNRSITPRSIDTDSDAGIDDNDVSWNSKKTDPVPIKRNTLGGSGWQPSLQKSPRTSFLNNETSNNSLSDKQSNEKLRNSNLSKQNSIFDDENSTKNEKSYESLFNKSPREVKSEFKRNKSSEESDIIKRDWKKKTTKDHKLFDENFDDDDEDKTNSFLNTIKFKDTEKVSRKIDDINKNKESNDKFIKSGKILNLDDDKDDLHNLPSSSRFLKTRKAKPTDEDLEKSDTFKSSNFKDEKFEPRKRFNKSPDEFDIFNKEKDTHKTVQFQEEQHLDDKLTFNPSKKFVLTTSNNPDLDHELLNSTKYIGVNSPHDQELQTKAEVKPKPRKFIQNKETDNLNDSPRRRFIRFEDETFDRRLVREDSPTKSDVSRQSSRKSSPSPPTSICEEVVQDPATLKLEALKKRREEKKRENETKFESSQNKLMSDSINAVADSQNEKIPDRIPTPSKERKSRPPSAKYKNVQPKVSTRINIKSLKSSLNDEWSSTPSLYSDIDNINSERSFTSSQSIRDTAYLQWYLAKLREKNEKKSSDDKNEDQKKSKTKEDSLAAYEAWKNAKREYFLELDRKRKEEIKKAEESKTTENKDNKSAELAYKVWKAQKEEKHKEESKKAAEEKRKKELELMKEREEKKEKKEELLTEWENRKAKEMMDKNLQKRKEEREKAEKENEMKNKSINAEEAYRKWENKADIKEKKYMEFEKSRESLINNRRAWRPSTNPVRARRI